MRSTRSCPYGETTSGSTATTSAAAAGTSQPPGSRRPMSGSAPTSATLSTAATPAIASEATLHQPLGPPDQHDRHQEIDADAAPFGEEDFAGGVDETDEKRCDQRAGDRANAADD